MTEMNAQTKKVYYNRVRPPCKLHDIGIRYHGAPKNRRSVELVKDGDVMFEDRAADLRPLDINWQRLHNEMKDGGFVGGIK